MLKILISQFELVVGMKYKHSLFNIWTVAVPVFDLCERDLVEA